MREAKLDCDLSRFFFRQAIGISSGERLDKRALAVIDVTGGRENEMFLHDLASRVRDTESTFAASS